MVGAPAQITETEEPQAPEQPIVEPAEPASPPEGGEQAQPEEGSGLDLKEVLKGATVAELKAVLDSVSPEVRTELESEIERRGEQRASTRSKEKTTAQTARQQAFVQQKAVGDSASAWLAAQLNRLDQGDFDALSDVSTRTTLRRAAADLKAAGVAENALAVEQEIAPLLEKYLPDLTEEEQQKLDKPLYNDARTGGVSHVPVLIELAIERAKATAFDEGVKKGEGNLAAKNALVEKLQASQRLKNQTAGVSPNGRAANPADARKAIIDEIDAIDPFRDPQAQDKLDALKRKLNAL